MRYSMILALLLATAGCSSLGTSSSPLGAGSPSVTESDRLQTINHYVRVRSTAPSMNGQFAQLYVRERASSRVIARGGAGVVLFVHGAGTPAEVAFDVPTADYSWMAYLANAGFDTFSVDMAGYGRSTRHSPMNDPCNLAADRQAGFTAPCKASYPGNLTTIASDWDDVNAAVDYVRSLRRVDKVSLVAWSLGGPRAGGYAARNPQKVSRLVLLAPGYNRTRTAAVPAKLPVEGVVFNTQSRAEFDANWDRQVGCPGQYDPAAKESVWSEMLASDPVGASWGPGVRRAPQTTTWGWDTATVAKQTTPTLIVQGIHDKQVNPERAKELYADLGAADKVLVDLGCASHNAMWEKNHTLLFNASLEWLEKGTVNGAKTGEFKMGY